MNKGPWETRLHKLASAQADVSLPNASRLISKLDALNRITTTAKDDVGLDGQTGEAATSALGTVASRADAIAQQVTSIQNKVDSANTSRRNLANGELDKLDKDAPGSLSGTQADILQAAVTGATFFLGPLSIVAGPGAVAAVNSFLAANRESTARASVQKISDAMDAYDVSVDPVKSGTGDSSGGRLPEGGPSTGTPSGGGPSGGPSGGGPRGGGLPGGSFGTYPNAHIEPLGQVDTGGYISLPGGTGGGHIGSGGSGVTPGHGIDGSITPDGPIDGGTTSPGWGSGGSGLGSGSGAGGGLGSTPGLAAGAGGAIALGGAKLIAAKGGSMLGTGLNAKVGSLGAGAKVGGLNAAAESAAARSGSLAGAGRAGTGGLLGSGSGSGAAGAAGEAAAGRGGAGGAGMMGGAGGVGGRSDEKRQGRGLGGPIAPKIDEDQERGPRSAAAGPGGRG